MQAVAHGNHHTGRNIHEVDLAGLKLLDIIAVTAGNAGTDETVVLGPAARWPCATMYSSSTSAVM